MTGFKGHIAIDPDSEIITATAVSAPGIGDAVTAVDLLADVLTTPTGGGEPFAVYGDAAYGSGELLTHLDHATVEAKVKVQPPAAPGGHFTKDRFTIDLDAAIVTCPADVTRPSVS